MTRPCRHLGRADTGQPQPSGSLLAPVPRWSGDPGCLPTRSSHPPAHGPSRVTAAGWPAGTTAKKSPRVLPQESSTETESKTGSEPPGKRLLAQQAWHHAALLRGAAGGRGDPRCATDGSSQPQHLGACGRKRGECRPEAFRGHESI